MKLTKIIIALSVSALSLPAQSIFNHPVQFNVGGGFTNGLYSTGKRTDTGYNLTGGVNFNIKAFGVRTEYQFNNMGINPNTSHSLGYPGGEIRVHSVTLNPMVDLIAIGPVRPYVIGGGGWYQVQKRFQAPVGPTFQGWDPYFNINYPNPVPASWAPITSIVNKGGINGGAGIKFQMWGRTKGYAEWRFHYVYTSGNATTYSPVTLGIQF